MILARVVFITTSYPRYAGDPAGHFVETEARAHAARADSVIVLAPGPGVSAGDGPLVEWLPGGDSFGWPGAMARLCERPTRALAAARFVVAARRALMRLDPVDLVIAHWILPWLLERLPGAVRLAIIRRLLSSGARFRFVSKELASRLARATTPALLEQSRIEASPIDLGAVPTRADARARLGIADRERIGVIAGRLVSSKRPEEAVRLAERHVDRVIVIGDGPLAARLRRRCPLATLTGQLPRADTLVWIAAADLLVSASQDEGAPTVVREARALGTPVLAVSAGDIADWARADPGITLVDPTTRRASA